MLQKTSVNWAKFVIGIFLSTVLSLSVHAVMLQQMNVSFPDLSVITTPYKFIIRIAIGITCGLIISTTLILNKMLLKIMAAVGIAAILMFAVNPLIAAAWV